LFLALLLPEAAAAVPALSASTVSGLAGSDVDFAVSLAPGTAQISSLQFDLVLPPQVSYASVSAGSAAIIAGKDAVGNANACIPGRVIVWGMNTNNIGAGSVAIIRLHLATDASGTLAVEFANLAASDANGTAVALGATSGAITVAGKSPLSISNLRIAAVANDTVAISWTTSAPADGVVLYGSTSTAFDSCNASSSTLSTTHSVTLTGLSAGSEYRYRVLSRDSAGNSASSANALFTTGNTPAFPTPVISGNQLSSVSETNAYVSWNTNIPADTEVLYGTTTGYCNPHDLNTAQVTSHGMWLYGLKAGTTYHYKIRSRSAQGNLATLGDLTFTAAGTLDATPPPISSVSAVLLNATAALITWITNEPADSQVSYGTTASYGTMTPLNSTLAATHRVLLTDLAPNTVYHYRVRSRDAAGNLAYSTVDRSFTTTASDSTPPKISSVAAAAGAFAATISWSTDELADSRVAYGLTNKYGAWTSMSVMQATSHKLSLSNLAPNTVYHYRVLSRDAAGNLAYSVVDRTFTTSTSSDTTPPKITTLYAPLYITRNSAKIGWITNEVSDSEIEYGLTASYGLITPLNTTMGISHGVWILNITPGTTYHYRVRSHDAAGNLVYSQVDRSFTTLS
jgi:hypothetical protein